LRIGSALEGGGLEMKLDLRIGVGFRLVLDRTDVEILLGSKPWTTL
jgi:hypothetical protein